MPLRYVDPARPTTALSRALTGFGRSSVGQFFAKNVAARTGGSRHPAWYHNLVAHPEGEPGGEPFPATEVTDPAEYARLYGLAEQAYAGYADYRAKAAPLGRHIPVLRLTPEPARH